MERVSFVDALRWLADPEPAVRLGTEAMTVAVLDLLGPGGAAAAQ